MLKEVILLNNAVTSKEEILKVCRKIVSESGPSSVNMRAVARRCDIALGSLYNYFPSKDDLLLATIESVWHDIFHMEECAKSGLAFPEHVQWVFDRVNAGVRAYPNFFTAHSVAFAADGKADAKQTMTQYFAHMKQSLRQTLERDPSVRRDAFNAAFTQYDFVDFVLSELLMLLMQHKESCNVLLEVVRRAIY